ncbi:hypothetical protein DL767_003655 [Monosporascus sp. MG133]|nr:hypothetical protein DL767_003655 [Monosporascus sp. MG133]
MFSEISDAFRLLQARKHEGKVVLHVSDNDLVPVNPRGMGGLSRSLLRWMASKGARNIVVTSRRGAKDPKAQKLLRGVSKLQVRTEVFTCDIGDETQCRRVLEEISQAGFSLGKVPEIVCAGALQLSEARFLAIVEAAMTDQIETQPVFGVASSGLVKANGFDNPYWFSVARFGPLRVYNLQKHNASASQSRAAGTVDLGMTLGAASSMYDAKIAVCPALMGKLAKSLMMELEDLDSAPTWALKEVQGIIRVSDVLKRIPMIELAGAIAGKSNVTVMALD